VFLGDFLHSKRSHAPETLAAIARWRAERARLELTLVRGNHDDRAGDPPASLDIRVVDEPLPLGPFALCHHPRPVPGAYVIAGHWHPCISVSGRAFERLRLPCFWFGDDSGALPEQAVGVLPAFGSFTGMHRIEPRAGDRIFPVAGDVVRAIPALPVA
jgi:DNA ligase-associated metallophosphoesterase